MSDLSHPARPNAFARIGRVIGITLVFTLAGPPIGAVVFMLATALMGFEQGSDVTGLGFLALFAVIYGAPLSYFIGGVPAAATGLIVGIWQVWIGPTTWLHAVCAGLLMGVLVLVLSGQSLRSDGPVSIPIILVTCLVPTLVCWLIVRSWGAARTLAGQHT